MQKYRPNLGYNYPERSDEHMLVVPHQVDTHYDENYRYYNKSFWYKLGRCGLWLLLHIAAFPILRLAHGLKIYGRRNIRRNRKLLKHGAVTICNHVFMWDYICVMRAVRPHLEYMIAWKTNFEGPNRNFIKWVGGMPVPTGSLRSMAAYSKAIDSVLDDGKWLHCYPEGSMWYYYPDIRPFKKGVFKYAVKHNKPVIPIGLSFRERKGLYKLFGKTPCVDMHIGEPVMPNTTLPYNDATIVLTKECYIKVQELVGINKGDPTYNENLNIDEYQKTM